MAMGIGAIIGTGIFVIIGQGVNIGSHQELPFVAEEIEQLGLYRRQLGEQRGQFFFPTNFHVHSSVALCGQVGLPSVNSLNIGSEIDFAPAAVSFSLNTWSSCP